MNACELAIGARRIGLGHRCFVMAEIGLAHDGSLGTAHAYIEAVAKSGADAIKFQTHIAEAESTSEEQFRVKFACQDATRYGYWKRTAFTEAQWQGLFDHAMNSGWFSFLPRSLWKPLNCWSASASLLGRWDQGT